MGSSECVGFVARERLPSELALNRVHVWSRALQPWCAQKVFCQHYQSIFLSPSVCKLLLSCIVDFKVKIALLFSALYFVLRKYCLLNAKFTSGGFGELQCDL